MIRMMDQVAIMMAIISPLFLFMITGFFPGVSARGPVIILFRLGRKTDYDNESECEGDRCGQDLVFHKDRLLFFLA
jgi:cbb3-type cytochrome oxidase subunit 3